jgi:hypothetical protein
MSGNGTQILMDPLLLVDIAPEIQMIFGLQYLRSVLLDLAQQTLKYQR